MSDRKVFEMNVMGCEWTIQLFFHDHGFDENDKYNIDGQNNISINFRKMHTSDELISVFFDALFDSIIMKFCGDSWDSKMLANVTSQVFLNPKSRRVIDKMTTYFNRYSMFGEDYEKYDADGSVNTYMFDSIEIERPHYWGFEIWLGPIDEDEDTEEKSDRKVGFSRFGFTEEYMLKMDPTKFTDGEEMAKCFDEYLEGSTTGKFIGLEDIKPSYNYEQLKRKLKSTNYEDIKQRLIDEYDDIVSEFKES